jgi:hypothetical protein
MEPNNKLRIIVAVLLTKIMIMVVDIKKDRFMKNPGCRFG